MENKNEAVIANYIEKMMGERRQKIFESDEYIQQDNGDLDYLEERYSSLKIPYVIRRVEMIILHAWNQGMNDTQTCPM